MGTIPIRRKFIDDGILVNFSRFQFHGRELGMVWGIGEVLRFHAKGVTVFILSAAFAGDAAVQKVSRVKLHSRLRGQDFEAASAGFIRNARDESQLPERFVKNPVMVITFSEMKLLVFAVDVRPDGRRLAKIEGRARDRA